MIFVLLALVTLFGTINATVFVYRWLTGRITIVEPTEAYGAACTGFYSSVDQPGIPLPEAGTNAYALTYGLNSINVTPGRVVCSIDGYSLYESIHVDIPITVGVWYIHDFYGFGYLSQLRGTAVSVTLTVEEPVNSSLVFAELRLYDAASGELLGVLTLTRPGASLTITLHDYQALRLDLYMDAYGSGETGFRVGFYVEQVIYG